MTEKKKVFAVIGSASNNSANEKLIEQLVTGTEHELHVTVFNGLKTLPHFDAELSTGKVPAVVAEFRHSIESADGVIISTPEYIFSIPAGLKNALEWCVATTVFSNKPLGIITASANGLRAHEELQLIMNTIGAKFTAETTLLIQGIRGKSDASGKINDLKTSESLQTFIDAFKRLVG